MDRNLLAMLLSVFHCVNSTVVNSSTSVNGSTTVVNVTGVRSTVVTDLLSSSSNVVSRSFDSGVIIVFFVWALSLFLTGVLLCLLCYEKLRRCRNNEDNSEIRNNSDDSAYISMLDLNYDSRSSRDYVGNSNAYSLGNDERNNNVDGDYNICVVRRSPDNISTVSSGSFASFRYSSESEEESNDEESDQYESGSEDNRLEDIVVEGSEKESIELQDICGVKNVCNNIAETVL